MSEKRFYEVIKPLWIKSPRMKKDDLYTRFIRLIQKVAELTNEEFKEDKLKNESLAQIIANAPNLNKVLDIQNIIQLIYELSVAYYSMKLQTMNEGRLNIDSDIPFPYRQNCLTLTLKPINKKTIKSIEEVMNEAKRSGIKDLANGHFSLVFESLERALNLCQKITDVYLIKWTTDKDKWEKVKNYFIIRSDYIGRENDINGFYFERIYKRLGFEQTLYKKLEKEINDHIDELKQDLNQALFEKDEISIRKIEEEIRHFEIKHKKLQSRKTILIDYFQSLKKEALKGDMNNFEDMMEAFDDLFTKENVDLNEDEDTLNVFIHGLFSSIGGALMWNEITIERAEELVKKIIQKYPMVPTSHLNWINKIINDFKTGVRIQRDRFTKEKVITSPKTEGLNEMKVEIIENEVLRNDETSAKLAEQHSSAGNEPKPKKITTEPKVEKSQPTKANFKSNEMSNTKQLLSTLFNEAIEALNKDFSNFDSWFDELNKHLEDYEVYLYGDEIATNEFLTVLLAHMNRMLNQGKVSLEKIDEINNYLFEYFGDEVLNHPYYKQLGETIKEINNGELIKTGKRKRRVAEKNINTMNEVDKAKTGESVKDEAPKVPTKEKVIRVARTPKPKIDFAEALKKQLKSTIKEHPFNFEVYQNPTKSTITFNKKGDIATIRPTFKAKITFP